MFRYETGSNDMGIALGGNHNTISNNSFHDNGRGIYLSCTKSNIFMTNTISENDVGIWIEESSEDNNVHYNNILNNIDYGINATENDGYSINATHNWWGDVSGPYHPVSNLDGKGNNVTTSVDFLPWLDKPFQQIIFAIIDSISPNPALDTDNILFEGYGVHGTGKDANISRYVWRSSIDGELYNGTEPSFTISNLSLGSHTISLKVKDKFDIWSPEVVAIIRVVMEEVPDIIKTKQLVNLTSGKTEIVEITGTNVTLEILVTTDLFDERIEIEETTNSTTLNIDSLAPGRYVNISVSANISDALKSALIKVYYSEELIPDNTSELSLSLFYWNDTNRGWEPMAICGLNTEENYVWARVSHFSIYGIGEFNFPPVADAGERLQASIGQELQFTGAATDHFNRNIIVLYEWDFDGDGIYDWSSSTTSRTTYRYDSPGIYYAKLRVTDDGGGKGFDTVEVVVSEEEDAGSSGLVELIALVGFLVLVGGLLSPKNKGSKSGDDKGDPMFAWPKGGNGLLLLVVMALLMNAMILLPCEDVGASGDDRD